MNLRLKEPKKYYLPIIQKDSVKFKAYVKGFFNMKKLEVRSINTPISKMTSKFIRVLKFEEKI